MRGESDPRAALRLLLRAVRAWAGNREAWGELWRVARAAGRGRLAAHAAARYADAAADDSLFWFTRYQMTGDPALLERALARYPSYAEAYLEHHVARPLAQSGDDEEEELGPIRRHLAIAAWMAAESEVLDLEELYRRNGALIARAFSAAELDEVLATFADSQA
jgi:hypothetical protein